MHFTDILTRKLVGDVKLVGTAVECGGMPPAVGGAPPGPHLQPFALATDAIGFGILRLTEPVFECGNTEQDAGGRSELRPSAAILGKGYNLDCLLVRRMHAQHAHLP